MPRTGKRTYLTGGQKADKIFACAMRRATRDKLEKLAAQSGRTLAGEVEAAVELSFMLGGNKSPTLAIMLLIAECIDGLISLRPRHPVSVEGVKAFKGEPGRWLEDPYLHEQAKQIVTTVFDLFRPPGKAESEPLMAHQGLGRVHEKLITLQTADLSKPKNAYQRWLAFVRSNIGDFLDRPAVGGIPATTQRARQLASAEYAEWDAIRLKINANKIDPNAPPITKEEAKRWKELMQKGQGQ